MQGHHIPWVTWGTKGATKTLPVHQRGRQQRICTKNALMQGKGERSKTSSLHLQVRPTWLEVALPHLTRNSALLGGPCPCESLQGGVQKQYYFLAEIKLSGLHGGHKEISSRPHDFAEMRGSGATQITTELTWPFPSHHIWFSAVTSLSPDFILLGLGSADVSAKRSS